MKQILRAAGVLLAFAACAPGSEEVTDPDLRGVEEIGAQLGQVAGVTWVGSTGTLTVPLAANQTGVIAKRSVDSAILVNGQSFTDGSGTTPVTATSTTVKKLLVTGQAGTVETVILDFANGTFGAGTGSTPGIQVDLNTGSPAVAAVPATLAVPKIGTLTAATPGLAGNNIRFRLVGDSGVGNGESVAIAGNDITVHYEDGHSTPADVTVAYRGNPVAMALATLPLSANAVALVAATDDFAMANLAGGQAAIAAVGDVFKVRGQKTADTFVLGQDSAVTVLNTTKALLAFNTDTAPDVSVVIRTAMTWTFALGGGNDSFDAFKVGGTTATNYGTGGNAFTQNLTVYGGDGNDTITGGTGTNVLWGDDGDDIFDQGATKNGGDTVHGGAGNDTVTYAKRTNGVTVSVGAGVADDGETGASEGDDILADVEIVIGGNGADVLTAAPSALGQPGTTLNGGPGNDMLIGGAGNDVFIGGAGSDTVTYAGALASVTVTIDDVANDGVAGEADNVKSDVEKVIGSTFADTITGSAGDNILDGGGGDDILSGGAGNDTFVFRAGHGNVTVIGGAGNDTVDFSAIGNVAYTIDMNADATTTVNSGPTGGVVNSAIQIYDDVENAICPSAAGTPVCTVTGNASDNTITGGPGNDVIDAGGGDDYIDGMGGTDNLTCGTGSDIAVNYGAGSTLIGCEL